MPGGAFFLNISNYPITETYSETQGLREMNQVVDVSKFFTSWKILRGMKRGKTPDGVERKNGTT